MHILLYTSSTYKHVIHVLHGWNEEPICREVTDQFKTRERPVGTFPWPVTGEKSVLPLEFVGASNVNLRQLAELTAVTLR